MTPTQRRFHGYQRTPLLWNDELLGLRQFKMPASCLLSIDHKINSKLRLGNYVERLVSHQLLQDHSIDILLENQQIIANKETLGEIDCIIMKENQPTHLEIAYKFYLYDPNDGTSFLEHWIGPNRRDSLVLKLNKIREKQFPLLHSEACHSLLKSLNLDLKYIKQRTYFKAQLFVPYTSNIEFSLLNKECLSGFYVNLKAFKNFQSCKFYIPKKLDWLIEPHTQVEWISFDSAFEILCEFHRKFSAPLIWVKHPNGQIEKLFVIWWN
jgi:hypothetical protein